MARTEPVRRGGPAGPVADRAIAGVMAGVVAVVTVGVVIGAAVALRMGFAPLIRLDESGIVAATGLTRSRPGLVPVLSAWQAIFQPRNVYLLAVVVCIWLGRRSGRWRRVLWCVVTMMLAWAVESIVKQIVQRPRPAVVAEWSHSTGWSFPSGHTANAAAAVTAVAIMAWPSVSARWSRVLWASVGLVWVGATALDRVLIGAHYPSDVVVGVVLGVGSVVVSFLTWTHWGRWRAERRAAASSPPGATAGACRADQGLSPESSPP